MTAPPPLAAAPVEEPAERPAHNPPTEYELSLARKAVEWGDAYVGWVGFMFAVSALVVGGYLSHEASSADEPIMFGVGVVLGLILVAPFFCRAKMQAVDQRRRHLYMDRH